MLGAFDKPLCFDKRRPFSAWEDSMTADLACQERESGITDKVPLLSSELHVRRLDINGQ